MNASEQLMTCRKAKQLTSKLGSVVDPGQTRIVPVYRSGGVRCRDCMILIQAFMRNVGTYWFNVKERGESYLDYSASTNVNQRGGATRNSDETTVMEVERRGCAIQPRRVANQIMGGVIKIGKGI